ncbi:MAG TPA: N-acetylneuraminate synthase [Chitinophagaceae bacterium]|nr:N-acetylneuraminate synthase [Chitinophagaceae bacterium]
MEPVLIIAEAGVNHNGSMEMARRLIDVALASGADAVKFQTFIATEGISRFARKAQYQQEQTGSAESQLDMVRKLELSFNQFRELKTHADQQGILFLSTPFDLPSIAFLRGLGIRYGKIPSGEVTNLPYLISMAQSFADLILSTGMTTLKEVSDALEVLVQYGASKDHVVVLHCNTEYPTPFQDANLRAIQTLSEELGVRTGYSDHTPGIEAAVAAVALGAVVVEKHFTLDQAMEGPDHKASLSPVQLREMVQAIRHVEKALGTGIKEPSPSEIKNLEIARKSLVASRVIRKGEAFTPENLMAKRPGTGISPMHWFEVLGTKAKKDFQEDELIEL